MLYKIVLKVVNGRKMQWKYFCSVPQRIYHDFVNAVQPDEFSMNAYLSVWARQDWGLQLNMGLVDDIERLKATIRASNQKAYSELYIFQEYELIPDEDFWIRLWVSSHMRRETEKVRASL